MTEKELIASVLGRKLQKGERFDIEDQTLAALFKKDTAVIIEHPEHLIKQALIRLYDVLRFNIATIVLAIHDMNKLDELFCESRPEDGSGLYARTVVVDKPHLT